MIKKVIHKTLQGLTMGAIALLLSSCGSKSLELSATSPKNQKTIFERLNLSTLYVIFSQEGEKIEYAQIQTTPFSTKEIKALYAKNREVLQKDIENAKLYDCIVLEKSMQTSQCKKEYHNSIFSKRVAKVMKNPIDGLDAILLPLTLVVDTLGQTTSNTKSALTTVEIDTAALKNYGAYMRATLSNDYTNAAKELTRYKAFLEKQHSSIYKMRKL